MADTGRSVLEERIKRNAGQTLFPAILVLIIGWWMLPRPVAYESATLCVLGAALWCVRIGGIVLVVAAAICWTGALFGMLLDALVSTVLTIAFAAVAVVLIPLEGLQLAPIVVGVFALVYARAAYTLWRDYRGLARAACGGDMAAEAVGPGGDAAGSETVSGEKGADVPADVESAAPPEGLLSEFGEGGNPPADSR